MTPTDVRALSATEYIAMLRVADEERREHERAAKKRARRR